MARILQIALLSLVVLTVSSSSVPKRTPPQNGNYVVTMKTSTDKVLKEISQISQKTFGRTNKLTKLVSDLKSLSMTSQEKIIPILESRVKSSGGQFTFESLWISNQIILRGADASLINQLEGQAEVESIKQDFAFELSPIIKVEGPSKKISSKDVKADTVPWGIDKIGAPQVWAQGFNGSGIIVAHIDTGAQLNHEAINGNYIGAENYGWYDPIGNDPSPTDTAGHGTHTMGTIAGLANLPDGQMKIGVAPGSRWMACKGCEDYCWVTDVLSCYQFLLCPRPLDNSTECDTSKAPNVISNSYFIDYPRGGPAPRDVDVEKAIDALNAAGIVSVVSIGNAGWCETSGYPGDYEHVIGVGATTSDDDLAYFSSSGPGTTHGVGVIKPEIVAPGLDVLSSVIGSGDEYDSYSGTSMAAPHVAGVVALLFSKNPDLGVYDIRNALFNTTDLMTMSETRNCGGVSDSSFPNYSLGWGRMNALAAVDRVDAKSS